MELTTTDVVSTHGKRDVAGPAIFGQRYIWRIIKSLEPRDEHLNLSLLVAPTASMTVGEAVRLLQRFWSRHESFRTSFQVDGCGVLLQDIRRCVEFPVEIWRSSAEPSRDDAREALRRSFTQRFDVSRHAQARGAIVVQGSRVRWIGVALSHMAADGWSVRLLRRELQDLAAGDEPEPSGDLMHPFDYKSYELSPRGRRANEAALEYWLRSLRNFPATYAGELARPPEQPRYQMVSMRSPTAFSAAQATAVRLRVTPVTVMIAAFADLLGRLSCSTRVPFLVRTGNRRPVEFMKSVGHYSQSAPVVIDTPVADLSAVYGKLLVAERHGYSDPIELTRQVEDTWPRACDRPSLNMTINPIPSPYGQSPAYSDVDSEPQIQMLGGRDEEHITLYCDVSFSTADVSLFVDTTFISSEAAATHLLGLRTRLLDPTQDNV